MVCRPDARPWLIALAVSPACLGAACYMPNPAFHVTSETDSGGSNSGTVGTTVGSSPSATDDPTTPSTSSDASASSSDTTSVDSTTSVDPTTPTTDATTETGVSDSLTDATTSDGTETGEPLDPPTCEGFAELPEVPTLAMELSIMDTPVADCLQTEEYTGWHYPLVGLEPGLSGLGFHDMECTEGVINLGPTHKLTGRFPEALAPVWSNDPMLLNAVECVTVRVEWGPPVEGECSIRSAAVWRHRNPEIEFFREPTPLWAAASNYRDLNIADHPLGPLAPIDWEPVDECVCVPEQQECCIEPLVNNGLDAGAYKAYPNADWDEADPILEGEDAEGRSTFMLQGEPICSNYLLRNHRARVEPLCEEPRESVEWVVVRDFIGTDGFTCQ